MNKEGKIREDILSFGVEWKRQLAEELKETWDTYKSVFRPYKIEAKKGA